MSEELEEVARKIIGEFREMYPYPHRGQGSSLAADLDRLWRVVQHWDRQRDAAVAKLKQVKAAAIVYKRAQDFELYELRMGRRVPGREATSRPTRPTTPESSSDF